MKHTRDDHTWLTIRVNAGYWFSPDTLRFFGSRIYWHTLTATNDGYFFISSEDNFDRTEKRYTVRYVNADYDIDTVGEFNGYASYQHAKTALKNIVGFGKFFDAVSAEAESGNR